MSATAPSLDLRDAILDLKRRRNAVILAHNYQIGAIQDLADYVGDSLGLAYKARETQAEVIAFCGVHFMAETAKIVNPGKTVVLPDKIICQTYYEIFLTFCAGIGVTDPLCR